MNFDRLSYFRALLLTLMLAVLSLATGLAFGADVADDYLHASGNKLYDSSGKEVRLTGIAWFGFETEQQVYHGLWSVNMEGVLDTVANRGFNLLRIPLSVELVNQWRSGSGGAPGSVNYSANPALQGLSSLQILDASLAYAKRIGLKVMLDMHRVINTQQKEGWYTAGYPAEDFEAGWRWLAERYKNDDTVVAVDLFNEPHGTPGNAAMIKWDASTDANNWKYEATKVANQILDINPKLLIVVQGIEATPKDGYTYAETNSDNYNFTWWGGNLRGVKNTPVNLGNRQSQLVYSPHDYGPGVYAQSWFHSGFTEASLTAECWGPNWLYIATQNIAPILVGEWGGRLDGGDNQRWLGFLAHTIATNGLNHTFWVVNPNSGDTGGILLDDWTSVDGAKYDLLKPTLWQDASGKFIGLDHAVNLGANGTHVGTGGANNAIISPTSANFDKNTANQSDIVVAITPNGNTLNAIRDAATPLVAGTDYTVSGNTVTLLKRYLATRPVGTASLSFDFNAGADPVLTVAISDSSNSSVPLTGVALSPTQLALNGATTGQVNASLLPANATNTVVAWNSSNPSVATVNASGLISAIGNGTATITVTASAQNGSFSATSTVTVTGIGGSVPAGCNAPVAVTLPLVLNGAGEFCRVTSGTISNVNSWNTQLVEINGIAYTNGWSATMPARINGNYYIRYVGQYAWSHLEVNGSGGGAVSNSTLGTSVASFDKNPLKQADISVAMTLNGNTLSAIRNGATTLVAGTDYTVSGATVTLLKGYLARQAVGNSVLAFDFSAGTDPTFAITIGDSSTSPANFTLTVSVSGNGSTSLTNGGHSYASGTTVSVTATPASGSTFTGWSGAATGTANPVSIKMDADRVLTANFSADGGSLPAKCPGTCNSATPVPPTVRSDGGLGNVTMYSTGPSAGGACNYGSTNVKYYAAINVNVNSGDGKGQWQGGRACGQCAEVTVLTSQGPKAVVVRIMDKCPDGNCGIDLGGSAPGAVMLDGAGRYTGQWRFVACDGHPEVSDGAPSLDVASGSNAWWSRIRIRNPLTAVSAIEWRDVASSAQGNFPFASDPENAYEVPTSSVLQAHTAAFTVTVRYVDGRSASVRLSPAQLGASGASYALD